MSSEAPASTSTPAEPVAEKAPEVEKKPEVAENEPDTTPDELAKETAKLTVKGDDNEEAKEEKKEEEKKEDDECLLEETTTEVEVIADQFDPNSPLFSAQKFEDPELGLTPELLKGIYAMKFKRPSRIQERALPLIVKQKLNLIAQAQNGTGKTAAFALSMLKLVDPALKQPQALLVCPTREIAIKNAAAIDMLAQFTGLPKCLVVVKDMQQKPAGQPIVVGTSGKLIDLFTSRGRKARLSASKLKMFVLDEADQLIDKQGQLTQIKKLKAAIPSNCQVLLFSATYSDEVGAFAEKFVPKPRAEIRLKRQELSLEKVAQFYVNVGTEDNKFNVLDDIYGYLGTGKSVIFVETKKSAANLATRLSEEEHMVGLFSSDLEPLKRDSVMKDFESEAGKVRVLVATNVLSRGVDVKNLNLVVNYDLPHFPNGDPDPETYLHRIGRTGRFGASGIAINLVHDQTSRQQIEFFEKYYEKGIRELKLEDIENLGDMLAKLGR